MTKTEIINSLASYAGLNQEQIDKAQQRKSNQLKEFYERCLKETENDPNRKSMARFCLHLICGIAFVDHSKENTNN